MDISYFVLFLCPVYVRGRNILQENSLIVIDETDVHQLPFDSSIGKRKIYHDMEVEDVDYLNVRTFPNATLVVFGGQRCGYVGYLLEANNTLNLSVVNFIEKNLSPVTSAAPGITENEIYGLTLTGDLVTFNLTDNSFKVRSEFSHDPPDSQKEGFQIDYKNLTICMIEVYGSESDLTFYNLDAKFLYEKLISIAKLKFHIDFSNKEIFGINNDTLYRGNVGSPALIRMSKMWKASNEIIDLTVLPFHIYLVVRGMHELVSINRKNSSIVHLDFELNSPVGIGSIYDGFGPDVFNRNVGSGVYDSSVYVPRHHVTSSKRLPSVPEKINIAAHSYASLLVRPSTFTIICLSFHWTTPEP